MDETVDDVIMTEISSETTTSPPFVNSHTINPIPIPNDDFSDKSSRSAVITENLINKKVFPGNHTNDKLVLSISKSSTEIFSWCL